MSYRIFDVECQFMIEEVFNSKKEAKEWLTSYLYELALSCDELPCQEDDEWSGDYLIIKDVEVVRPIVNVTEVNIQLRKESK